MTIRSSKRWKDFGRHFVLGGFALVKPTPASGGETDEGDALLKRERGSAKVAVVRDVGQESLNGTTGSRPEKDDRQAIERGEDEGMMLGRE